MAAGRNGALAAHFAFIAPIRSAVFTQTAFVTAGYIPTQQALSAFTDVVSFLLVARSAGMICALGAFSAAIIASAAVVAKEILCAADAAFITMVAGIYGAVQAHVAVLAPWILTAISAALAMVFFVAVSSTICTAMISAVADVVVAAERAAEFTLAFLIPRQNLGRHKTDQKQNT